MIFYIFWYLLQSVDPLKIEGVIANYTIIIFQFIYLIVSWKKVFFKTPFRQGIVFSVCSRYIRLWFPW